MDEPKDIKEKLIAELDSLASLCKTADTIKERIDTKPKAFREFSEEFERNYATQLFYLFLLFLISYFYDVYSDNFNLYPNGFFKGIFLIAGVLVVLFAICCLLMVKEPEESRKVRFAQYEKEKAEFEKQQEEEHKQELLKYDGIKQQIEAKLEEIYKTEPGFVIPEDCLHSDAVRKMIQYIQDNKVSTISEACSKYVQRKSTVLEVLKVYRYIPNSEWQRVANHKPLLEVHLNGVIFWIAFNADDFYPWLKRNHYAYYKHLRKKNEKYIFEEFSDSKTYSQAKSVLDEYLIECNDYKPLLNPSTKIDLKYCPPIVRDLQRQALSEVEALVYFNLSHYNCSDYQLRLILKNIGITYQEYGDDDGEYAKVPANIKTFFMDSSYQQQLIADYYRRHQVAKS